MGGPWLSCFEKWGHHICTIFLSNAYWASSFIIFPKTWSELSSFELKTISSKTSFNKKLKNILLDQLDSDFKCNRLLCPACHLQNWYFSFYYLLYFYFSFVYVCIWICCKKITYLLGLNSLGLLFGKNLIILSIGRAPWNHCKTWFLQSWFQGAHLCFVCLLSKIPCKTTVKYCARHLLRFLVTEGGGGEQLLVFVYLSMCGGCLVGGKGASDVEIVKMCIADFLLPV